MKIEVTQEDIERGKPRCLVGCPISRALHRTLGGTWWVTGLRTNNEDGKEYKLPEECDVFVEAFDKDQPVAPFTFDLDLPATTLSREGKGE